MTNFWGFASDGGRAVPIDLMLDSGVITLSARALGGADRWDVSGEVGAILSRLNRLMACAFNSLWMDGASRCFRHLTGGGGGLYLQRGGPEPFIWRATGPGARWRRSGRSAWL